MNDEPSHLTAGAAIGHLASDDFHKCRAVIAPAFCRKAIAILPKLLRCRR